MAKNQKLISALKEYFGFETFKGNQEAIIENLLAENDTFVLMPTGGGKSLCYQLPARLMEGTAIVISPLIALMKNQVDAMRSYSEEDGIAHFINSSLTKQAIEIVKDDVRSGRTKLLYVAPESLTKDENVAFLQDVPISFYAVDEAHCISEWGHDFRPEYRNIRPIINRIGERPIIALTATATPKVQHDIQKNLGMTEAAVFKSSFNRPNLYYEVRPKTKDVDREIIKFIKANEGKSGIIYCLSRKRVEELAEVLRLNDIKALYEAGFFPANTLTASDAETVELFNSGEAAFLIDGSWKVGYFTENAEDLNDFAIAYVPGKGERSASEAIGGISMGYFITTKAWNDPDKREAAVEFVSQLTSDETLSTFVTTEVTALVNGAKPEGLNPLQQSAADANANITAIAGAVQDSLTAEARGDLFANVQNVVTGKMSAEDAVASAIALN